MKTLSPTTIPPVECHGLQGAYRVSEDLFLIPEQDGYILYVPHRRNVLLVNKSAVRSLQRLGAGDASAIVSGSEFEVQLIDAGMLVPADSPTQGITFDQLSSDFDPTGVSLLLTGRCSMRCVYCYSSGGERATSMPWNTAKAAINWIVAHTAQKQRTQFYLSFHGGGEVTMTIGLMKRCVAYARDAAMTNNLTVHIESGLNGVMSEKTTEWVIHNLDAATVSLDGLPDIHDAQRPLVNGKGSFERVRSTLQRMDAHGFRYGIRLTVTDEGVTRLADSVDFISRSFAAPGGIQAEPVFRAGRAKAMNLPPVDPKVFVEQYRQAAVAAERHGKRMSYSGARFNTITNSFCKAVSDSFAVTPDSLVTSCYEVSTTDDERSTLFVFGSLDPGSGEFSFDTAKLSALRALTVEHKPTCQNCFCKWHCAGDCPAKLAALGDAWDPSDSPRCYINRELTKDQIRACFDA